MRPHARIILAAALAAACALPAAAADKTPLTNTYREVIGPGDVAIENTTKTAVRCYLKTADKKPVTDLPFEPLGAYTGTYTPGLVFVLDCPKVEKLPFGPIMTGNRYALIYKEGHLQLAKVTN